ncbi:MAG: hypothetical protein ACLFQK_01375 [Fibrobacterota bacterium]
MLNMPLNPIFIIIFSGLFSAIPSSVILPSDHYFWNNLYMSSPEFATGTGLSKTGIYGQKYFRTAYKSSPAHHIDIILGIRCDIFEGPDQTSDTLYSMPLKLRLHSPGRSFSIFFTPKKGSWLLSGISYYRGAGRNSLEFNLKKETISTLSASEYLEEAGYSQGRFYYSRLLSEKASLSFSGSFYDYKKGHKNRDNERAGASFEYCLLGSRTSYSSPLPFRQPSTTLPYSIRRCVMVTGGPFYTRTEASASSLMAAAIIMNLPAGLNKGLTAGYHKDFSLSDNNAGINSYTELKAYLCFSVNFALFVKGVYSTYESGDFFEEDRKLILNLSKNI